MAYFLIFFGAALRFFPHPPNFAPITAIAIFAGAYLSDKRLAIGLPLATMLVSDYFIGFYSLPVMASVYLSFAISGLVGLWLKSHKTLANSLGVTLFASLQFFFITNFAVWAFGKMYSHDISGLLTSYINGLPFFRSTLLGDLFYVGIFFCSCEIVRYYQARKSLTRKPNVLNL